MSSYNRTIMTGRVATEPDMKKTKGGTKVIRFILAVDNLPKKGQKPTCEFIPHEIYGERASALNDNLRKGMLVQTEGSLHSGSWVKNGMTIKAWKVIAQWIGFQAWPRGKGAAPETGPEPAPSYDDRDDYPDEYPDENPF